MDDKEYVAELEKLCEAYLADEISTHEWRTEMGRLRDRRSEGKGQEGKAQS